MRPLEASVRGYYLAKARRKLRDIHPVVVAVAGSYGKTSTKHILAHLLGGEDVLPTRKSFNTLMGVTRVVNEDLLPDHRVFIVEMDAYAEREIASISDLVHPRYAVLTSVGPQHLERFGSVERIADALYECVAALPPDGPAVIHTGDAGGVALARRALGERHSVVRYALEGAPEGANADVVAADVRISSRGTAFRWRWPARELECDVAIPLLGRHQALNVTAALTMVVLLGRSLDAAVRTARTLQPVEHRLQPMQTGGPVTVIDDSYNANPVGVHEGLDVLATFEAGAKILVTPGLVELGDVEEEENRRYGRHAAAVCDQVIVAEARTAAALVAGLREGGMSSDRIHLVRGLAETTALIGRLARSGDVVLFANDLPDTYLAGPSARRAVTTAEAGG
jgi:UDP-N-acetylmuramoyl-tripeptide--D-alanyl-D-alanine ligase